MAWLLDRYSSAYASNQYRAPQQFFKWLAAEDELPGPMGGQRPPRVTQKLVPVFTGEELTRLVFRSWPVDDGRINGLLSAAQSRLNGQVIMRWHDRSQSRTHGRPGPAPAAQHRRGD